MSQKIELTSVFCPAFYPVHRAIWSGEKSEIWLMGGRGSTKSSFVAIQIVLGIMRDPNANAMCLRKVGDTIRTSLFSTFQWAIGLLQVERYFSYTVSPAELTYTPTGQKIILKGLDDPLKLKSVKAKKGYFKYLWFEEAVEFNGMDEIRNVEQSVLRGGDAFVEFITYNPPNDPNAWVNVESKIPAADRLIHASTYLDVNPAWLGDKFIEKALRLKEQDPLKYQHEYMGEAVGRAEQIVFYGKWQEKAFETPPLDEIYQNKFFFGADFGFAADPSTLVRMFILVKNNKMDLHIDYEAGGVGIEFEDLPDMYEKIPLARRWKIYADCARPETISFLSRKGFNIEGAPKWQGSVEDGVEYLKSFNKIYIHPRCTKTIEEFMKYSYKVDRHTQEILPVLVDAWNHYLDACIAEGELITTSNGNIPIEQIKVGDLVLTRYGYKQVEQAICTGVKEIWEIKIGDKTLLATANHKIYTKNGFTRVDALRYDDMGLIIIGYNLCKLNILNFKIKNTIATLKAKIGQIVFILSMAKSIFIGRFGNSIMGKFLKVIISTIKTIIRLIMTYLILNALHLKSIFPNILLMMKGWKNNSSIWRALTIWRRLGTQAQKEDRNTKKLEEWHIKISSQLLKLVNFVAMTFCQNYLVTKISSAQINASLRGEGSKGLTISQKIALFVKKHLFLTNIQNKSLAPAYVVSIAKTNKIAKVYDLAIKDCPEFFASGVLVHNCRYALADYIKHDVSIFDVID